MPSLVRQAANFAWSMGQVAVGAVTGQGLFVTETEQLARHGQCQKNQCGRYLPDRDRCAHPLCGCIMKEKTRLKMMKCPEGLWPEQNKEVSRGDAENAEKPLISREAGGGGRN